MALSETEIRERLSAMPGWQLVDNAIVRQFRFEAFSFAVAFVTCLGFDAEVHDHHPDIRINYTRVTVSWTTHSAGGVTEKDFAGAKEADRVATAMGHRA